MGVNQAVIRVSLISIKSINHAGSAITSSASMINFYSREPVIYRAKSEDITQFADPHKNQKLKTFMNRNSNDNPQMFP